MSKKIKYNKVKSDEIIDISLSLGQAAALLDLVAEKAMINKDCDLMVAVADRWIDIAKLFVVESEPVEHSDTNSKTTYGFGLNKETGEGDE